ncbi:hypothetical protein Tco_0276513 [Tanacetum coccineum]
METRLETRLEVTKLQQRLTPLVEEEQTLIPTLLRVLFQLNNCHPIDIDLIPRAWVVMTSSIGMDWLGETNLDRYCDEKVVSSILNGNEC